MNKSNVNQVAAFGKLVGICNDLGARYNPSKAALTTTALATLLEQAQQSLEAVNVARVNYVLAINSRQDLYAGIYGLAARIVRALQASESSGQDIRDARMIKRKLSSRSKGKEAVIAANGKEEGTVPISGSLSRMDFENRLNTFSHLVHLVERITTYTPNESDLKVASLHSMVADLRQASRAVAQTANVLANARMHRNAVMKGKEGMFEISNAVKDYIRSVFGVSSEPVKELMKLNIAA